MHYRPAAFILLLAALAAWALLANSAATPPYAPSSTEHVRPVPAELEARTSESPIESPSGGIDREAQGPPASGSSRESPELRFELNGVANGEYRGSVFLQPQKGEATSVAIVGPSVVVPVTDELRRVDFAVDGYCVAAYLGPFAAKSAPIRVPLYPAGEILVDVLDTNGSVLADRLVYCYPLKSLPFEGPISYRTTPWAHTDARGKAHLTNVIAGAYRVHIAPFAEWDEAEVLPVQVSPRLRNACTLNVPVLPQDRFGAFVMAASDATFVAINSAGIARNYCFWADGGRDFKLYCTGETLRCIILGTLGEVVRGRIQWRTSSGVKRPSKESDVITVTVGAVLSVTARWSDV